MTASTAKQTRVVIPHSHYFVQRAGMSLIFLRDRLSANGDSHSFRTHQTIAGRANGCAYAGGCPCPHRGRRHKRLCTWLWASDFRPRSHSRNADGRRLRVAARWTSTFLHTSDLCLCHAVSGTLGIAGIEVPLVEIGIAFSVVVLGAVVAFDIKAQAATAMGVVGLFAIFHGQAHGAEIPEDAGGVAYAAGFMIATALLHLAGISAGFLMGKASEHYGSVVVRLAGGIATVAGVALLVGTL